MEPLYNTQKTINSNKTQYRYNTSVQCSVSFRLVCQSCWLHSFVLRFVEPITCSLSYLGRRANAFSWTFSGRTFVRIRYAFENIPLLQLHRVTSLLAGTTYSAIFFKYLQEINLAYLHRTYILSDSEYCVLLFVNFFERIVIFKKAKLHKQ